MIICGFTNIRNIRFFARYFSSNYVESFETLNEILTLIIIVFNIEFGVVRLFQFTSNQSTQYYIGHNYYI
jgi:hypothetical protein